MVRAFISCFFLAASLASAQSTAGIVGKISDPSGASVSGAKVTVRNTVTGLVRETTADSAGDYELLFLPITGSYTLTVEKSGFQTHQLNDVVLQVDQRARFDVALGLSSVSDKVVVEAAAPVVNTESGSIGQVIGNKFIVDLPLNGRNYTQLATLLPNAVVQTQGTAGSTVVSVSGGRLGKTEFLLNGISINEQLFDGVAIRPSVDAIQEFKLLTNSFSAEYGRGNAVMLATIKSGTNQFHGVVYEFLRNDALDARNTFLATKPPYRQNQFGGAGGGPIKKDKMFIFLNYEGTRIRQGLAFNPVVPTAAFRSGDFSSLSTVIRDPTTQLPLPGNKIPASLIDPATSYFLQFMPLPTNGTSAPSAAPFRSDVDQSNARYDYRINSANSLFVSHTYTRRENFNPGNYTQNGGTFQDNRTHNAAISDTNIFTPNLINELRLGYTRFYNANSPQGLGTNYTVQSGIGGFDQTSQNFPGFPQLSISGYAGIAGNSFSPLINPSNMYEAVDNVSWVKGRHTFLFGIDYRNYHFTSTNSANSRGGFSFTGTYTGNAFADYLTGYPFSGSRDFPRNQFGETDRRSHFYVQDDWKVNSRLTLNLGLRYELNFPPDVVNDQAARYDFVLNKIEVMRMGNGNINLTTQQVAQYAYPLYQQYIITPQSAGLPNNLIFTDYRDWAPRAGLAYRPFENNKTVVRAGFGIFYLLTSGNNTVSVPIINAPFILDESGNQTTAANGAPQKRIENFFAPISSNAGFTPALAYGFDPHMVTPRMTQYNFAIQQELARDFALEVAYVGNQSHHLERENQPANYAPINPSDTRPVQQRRPNPAFAAGNYFDTSGNANYNGLEVKLEKRFSRGYQFLLGYSWSKTIDMDTSDQGGGSSDNPYNYRTMRGPSDIDFKQRFVASFVLDLPFGRGRAIANTNSVLANAFIGGWQLGGIITLQGGLPFTPVLGSADPTGSGRQYGLRPNVIGDGHVANPNVNQWFNIADFAIPATGTIGNAGRNILRGPGISNQDLSLHKNFNFTERLYLEFRAEYFNALNITNLSNPNANIDLPSVGGKIFSTSTPARIGQLGLKLYF